MSINTHQREMNNGYSMCTVKNNKKKQMKKLLLLTFLYISFFCEAQQIPVIDFQKCIGGTNNDETKAVTKTKDGGWLIVGATSSIDGDVTCDGEYFNDFWITKLNNSVNIEWQKCLGGSFSEAAYDVIQTSDLGFLIVGLTNSNDGNVNGLHGPEGIYYDCWIIKLDSTGSLQWQKTMGGINEDVAKSVVEIKNKGYLIAAETQSDDGDISFKRHDSTDYWMIMLDFNGTLIWEKTLGGSGNEEPYRMINTLDGGNIIAGSTYSNNGDLETNEGNRDGWLLKLDTNGIIEWSKTFGGISDDYLTDVIQLEDSSYMLTGILSISNEDVWVMKIDKIGNKIWEKTFGGNWFDFGLRIAEAKNNIFYVLAGTGSTNDDIPGSHVDSSTFFQPDIWFLEINRNGNLLSQKCLGGTLSDISQYLQIINDTSVLIIGNTSSANFDLASTHLQNPDGQSDIWFLKLKLINSDKINGFIFKAQNSNCIQESNEKGIPNVILKTEPKNFYAISDSNGRYSILTDTGKYSVKQIIPNYALWLFRNVICPSNGMYQNISFTQYGQDTTEINFANDVTLCAFLQVELAQSRMRRCFDNTTAIKYCNIGNIDTTNVQVIVTLPEYVTFVSASNPNYTISGKKITFNIGTLRANECGTINLITKVDCVNGIVGLTQCISAYILPRNKCVDQIQSDYALWDKSEVSVDGRCTGNTARFVIKNISQNNMTDSSSYRIYKDAVQAVIRRFKLIAGDSLVINVTATGNTYRLEADQVAHFPSASLPSVTIENCGTGVASRGFVNQQAQNTVAPDVEKICLPIRDSYDPNDKSVSPTGVGANKLVKHKVPLDYLIRFQNTGTDTAYTVVIVDTLDQNLDLSTLEFGASSHKYKIEFTGSGKPILKFTFDKINLVDSFTNEPKSHGFVSFKITPYDSIPNGTLVKNSADIYFDFNLPIKTNTTQVSIDDRLPTGATLSFVTAVKEQKNNYEAIYVYPNPFNTTTNFEFVYNTKATQLIVYNINGELVANENVANQTRYQFQRNNLSNGMYFYVVQNKEGETIGRGKIVLQ